LNQHRKYSCSYSHEVHVAELLSEWLDQKWINHVLRWPDSGAILHSIARSQDNRRHRLAITMSEIHLRIPEGIARQLH
jgi:hypothetical protein